MKAPFLSIKDMKMRNQKGFTLVELMIGALILGVTFVGMLLTFVRCLELNEMTRNSSLAVKIAKSRIEQIKNTDFNQVFATYNNVTFTNASLTGMGISYVDNSNADLLEIKVSYCWREKSSRVVGEDANVNGALNAGEDKNANGEIDSPVTLITYIYRRT